MVSSIYVKHLILCLILMFISINCFKLVIAQPRIAGTGIGYIPQPGAGVGGYGNGGIGGGGFGGINGGVLSKALLCLSDKLIYSGCEESYRLTESGDLHVPPEYTDEYCSGPCFKETTGVLKCINNVLSNFIFYNRATVRDVQNTITTGCSYGPTRGNFNVAENILAYASNSYKFSYTIRFGILPLISMCILLF